MENLRNSRRFSFLCISEDINNIIEGQVKDVAARTGCDTRDSFHMSIVISDESGTIHTIADQRTDLLKDEC